MLRSLEDKTVSTSLMVPLMPLSYMHIKLPYVTCTLRRLRLPCRGRPWDMVLVVYGFPSKVRKLSMMMTRCSQRACNI